MQKSKWQEDLHMVPPEPIFAQDSSHHPIWLTVFPTFWPFLKAFPGPAITDGYQVYHKLTKKRRVLKVAGHRVHTRRPFAEFIKSVGLDTTKGLITQEAYLMITEIMHFDNTFDDLSVTDRKSSVRLFFRKKWMLISHGQNIRTHK